MTFADRVEAGELLGEALLRLDLQDPVVLGIPRGGLVVAAEVARALGAPLDVVVPRKVRAPRNPELGLGAVAPGVTYLDEDLVAALRVPAAYLAEEIETERIEVERRSAAYRSGRPPVELAGRAAIVVDDGIATGGTAIAALRWARSQGSARVVLAVPVAPPVARSRLAGEADLFVALAEPAAFYAVGQWYADFTQVDDDEVVRLMSGPVEDP